MADDNIYGKEIPILAHGGSASGESLTVEVSPEGGVILPGGIKIGNAEFAQSGLDLVVTAPDGAVVVIDGYFIQEHAPILKTQGGGELAGDTAIHLARVLSPSQEVIASPLTADAQPIGEVESIFGTVVAIRANGDRVELKAGDPVFQCDVLQSGVHDAVGIALADESILSMAESGRIVLEEVVCDPGTLDVSISIFVLQGVFNFASGQVAKVDPDAVNLKTPVATIGIRGAQVGIDLRDTGEGEPDLQVVLMERTDGSVGEVVISNAGGIQTLKLPDQGSTVTSATAAPAEPRVFQRSEIHEFLDALNSLPTAIDTANNCVSSEVEREKQEQENEEITVDKLEDKDEAETGKLAAQGSANKFVETEASVENRESADLEDFETVDSGDSQVLETSGSDNTHSTTTVQHIRPRGEKITAYRERAEGNALQVLNRDGSAVIRIVGNDSDLEVDCLTVTGVTQPVNGTVLINDDGTVTYTPNANYTGDDRFFYTIVDRAGNSDTAAISLIVTGDVDAPVVVAGNVTGAEDGNWIALDLGANIVDTDSAATLSVTITNVPTGALLSAGTDLGGGIWTVAPEELTRLSINPAPDFTGTVGLSILVTSAESGGDTATADKAFAVTIAPTGDVSLSVEDETGASGAAAINLGLSTYFFTINEVDGSEEIKSIAINFADLPEDAVVNNATCSQLTDTYTVASAAALPAVSVMPPQDWAGEFSAILTVASNRRSASQSFSVIVSDGKDAPIVTLSPAFTVNENDSLMISKSQLPASGSEVHGDTLFSGSGDVQFGFDLGDDKGSIFDFEASDALIFEDASRDYGDPVESNADLVINAAIVGLGWWGRYIISRFTGDNKSRHLAIRRIVDIDIDGAGEFALEHGLELTNNLDSALADDDIDAVIIATPNSLHGSQILKAAGAGKHVFCEKPLDLTHAAALASLAACREAGVVLGIGHERRFEPAWREIKRLLDADELGTIMHLEANFNHDKLVALPVDNWRASAFEAPGASLTATGVHLTDAFLHFHGPIATVYALTGNWVANFQSGDLLSVQLRFEDGATGYINSILSSPLYSYIRVFGTKGWVQVSDSAHPSEFGVSTMTICRGEGDLETREFQSIDTVRANLEAFAIAAAGGTPYPFTDAELTGNIAVFEAICRSVESGVAEPVG